MTDQLKTSLAATVTMFQQFERDSINTRMWITAGLVASCFTLACCLAMEAYWLAAAALVLDFWLIHLWHKFDFAAALQRRVWNEAQRALADPDNLSIYLARLNVMQTALWNEV